MNQMPLGSLSTFVRTHHVHYDVTPDVTLRGSERLAVGYVVRLWAVHEKGAKALPGCAMCRDLVDGLRQIAMAVCTHEPRPTLTDIQPFDHALYDSRVVPGADEVAICIRLAHRTQYDAPIDECEDRCLREIRAALKKLGAEERS